MELCVYIMTGGLKFPHDEETLMTAKYTETTHD